MAAAHAIRPVEVCVVSWAVAVEGCFAAAAGDPAHHYGGAGLGGEEEVEELGGESEEELDEEDPTPGVVVLDETSDDGTCHYQLCLLTWTDIEHTKSRPRNAREDHESNSILLLVRPPHISNHAECDTASSRRQTQQHTRRDH